MITILILIAIIIGLSFIPLLTKMSFPKVEKIIIGMLIFTFILFLIFTIFEFNGFRLKWVYTFPTIILAFIVSNLFYFSLVQNTKKKIVTVFLMTPLIIFSILTFLLNSVIKEFKINETYKMIVTTGGPLSCGEVIKVTKPTLLIFNKEVYYESSLCLIWITKIETIEFGNGKAEFLIYHNGEMDSENPYRYEIESKNI